MGLPQVTLWLVPLTHPNTWLRQPLLGEAFPGVQCLNSVTHLLLPVPCPARPHPLGCSQNHFLSFNLCFSCCLFLSPHWNASSMRLRICVCFETC